MREHPHASLIDLLAMHESAGVHGCGLEAHILEMLLDHHATPPDTVALDHPIRTDGPLQMAQRGMTRIKCQPQEGCANAWR